MTMRWRGLMAPDDRKTGDRRAFAPGVLTHRKLPLPAEWVREKGAGHSGAVTVANIDAVYAVEDGLWGTGELLDPMFIPDVTPFAYLAAKGLVGPSVDLDPDLTYTFVPDPDNPAETVRLITRGNIHGVTFVSTPAFAQVSVEIYDDEEAAALLASAGIEAFAVNSRSWRSWPIADKATPWSADASIARLAAWSGGDGKKYAQAFLYYDAKSRADVRESYRLPIADVVNGKLVLVPRAVYQAAAFLSGAHGGVKDIPDNEVQPLQRVVTEIYAVLAQAQQDDTLTPPWQRGGRQGAKDSGPVNGAHSMSPWKTPQNESAPSAGSPSGSPRRSVVHAASCTASSAMASALASATDPTATASRAAATTSSAGAQGQATPTNSSSETETGTKSTPSESLIEGAGRSSGRPTASPSSSISTWSEPRGESAPSASSPPVSGNLLSITAPSPAASGGSFVPDAISASGSSTMTRHGFRAQPPTSEEGDTMQQASISMTDDVAVDTEFAVRTSGWSDMPTSTGEWDEGAARAALDSWAGDDIGKYGRAFLWSDGSGNKTGFKFPIAKPVNGTLTVFIRAVNNAKARLSSANIPAADKAKILSILNRLQESYDGEDESGMALVAAGMERPPAEWFADPKLTKPTPLEVDENGRVWGHLALFGTCHKAFRHKCVMPPRSHTDYKHFKLGKVLTDDGRMVRVGRVTVGTGHADDRFGVIPAREHYDNTGTCAAVVVPYEDKFGVALAGATVQGLSEEKVAELRRSPLSGDWRRTNGNLELVGALAVNDPGFEVVAEDEAGVFSLTAAGTFRASELESEEDCGCTAGEEPRDWSALLAEVDEMITNMDSAARVAAFEALKE